MRSKLLCSTVPLPFVVVAKRLKAAMTLKVGSLHFWIKLESSKIGYFTKLNRNDDE